MNYQKQKYKIIWVLAGIVSCIILIGILRSQSNSPASSDLPQNVDFSGPTEIERESGNTVKEDLVSSQDTPTPNNATIAISQINQSTSEITVRSFVTNSVEDGSCTVSIAQQNNEFSQTVEAIGDASSTFCAPAIFEKTSEFVKGSEWTIIVEFTGNSGITGKTQENIVIN